ncbi:hypothetical protein [Nostoc sp. CENA543]|uniref:hypothetical protein n=1 Tax=Nostoc sp. CENA543 TaxID=1869241 RepID=UPI001864A270|nr:hypothetical protein [Nostoc sp. CENA543]
MQAHNKQLHKLIVYPLLIALVTVGAIASASTANTVAPNSTTTPKQSVKNQGIYRSDRFKFQFSYSTKDFVIDNKISTPRNPTDSPLASIDIWTKNHAQKLRNGEYAGGTEYPANVSITINNNPKKLPLQRWVQQSNQFSATRDFKAARIAGQTGIKFQSSGLYEDENVAFVNPRDGRIIVIKLSKTNYGNNDAIYRQAYQQVINSFTLLNNRR